MKLTPIALLLGATLLTAGCQMNALTTASAPVSAEVTSVPFAERSDMVRGQLANGMNYIVVENDRPSDRVSLQLVVHAGSLDEEPDQLGIAHLVEHMAFNGTTAYPANRIIERQEELGMVFGRDVNAMTEFYTTSYFLHLPNHSPELMDEGMFMLAQQASALTFDQEELEKERPVVEEEWRSGRNMMGRLSEANRKITLAGSRFGARNPIGDMELVRNVDAKRIKAFWESWYHPNNMTLIAVGSTTPQQIEQLLNKHFGAIRAAPLPKRPDLSLPIGDQLTLHSIEDSEITTEVISLNFRAPEAIATNEVELRSELLNQLTVEMLRKRLKEQYQVESDNISRVVSMSLPLATGYRNNRMMALLTTTDYLAATKEIFNEVSRYAAHGFSQTDLEVTRDNLVSRFKSMAQGQKQAKNRRIMMSIFNNLRTQRPLTDSTDYYHHVEKVIQTISLNDINQHMAQFIQAQPPLMIAQIKPENADKLPTDAQLKQQWQQALATPPPTVKAVDVNTALLKEVPEKAAIKHHEMHGDTHIWTLENDTQVWFHPSDETPEQLMLRYQGVGGTSHLPVSQRRAAQQIRSMNLLGYGGHSALELGTLNAGLPIRLMTFVTQDTHGIIGGSDRDSFEAWLQNVYLQVTEPNTNETLWDSRKKLIARGIEGREKSAGGQFNYAIDKIRYANNPMLQPLTLEELAPITSADLTQAWHTLFGDAKNHHLLVVGDADPEQVISLAQRYIGSLPSKQGYQQILLPPLAKGKHQVRIADGEEPMALTSVMFNVDLPYNRAAEDQAFVLSRIINVRLREQLREAAGGVYTVRFGIRLDRDRNQAFGMVSYSHSPDRANELKAIAQTVLNQVAEHGVTQEEIDTVVQQTQSQLTADNINDRMRFSWLQEQAQYNERFDMPNDFVGWLDQVTPAHLKPLAQKILRSENIIDAQLLPKPEKHSS